MTQREMIKNHLQTFGSITPMEALNEYGCFRLAARIADLKREGMEIKKESVTHLSRLGKKISFARYRI